MYQILLLALLLFCAASPVGAHDINSYYPQAREGFVRFGYTRVSTEIPPAQKDLLSAVVEYRFNANVVNVGQALHQVLNGSGFMLAPPAATDPNLPALLQSPLPKIQRHMGPARIDAILEAIAGPAWELVVDPVHRLVSFELRQEFWPCGYQPAGNSECGR